MKWKEEILQHLQNMVSIGVELCCTQEIHLLCRKNSTYLLILRESTVPRGLSQRPPVLAFLAVPGAKGHNAGLSSGLWSSRARAQAPSLGFKQA